MNSEEKTRIAVDICGTQYKLMGTSSVGYMKMVASHVHNHMNKIAKGHPRLDTTRIAVLAAVNMADEFFKQKEEWEKRQENNELEQLAEQYRTLKGDHEELQEAYNSSLDRLEEHKLKELGLMEDYRKLQQELDNVKLQHEGELLMIQDENKQLEDIHEAHRKLQEEYAKLQNEYNEWIQLAEREPPGRN